MYILEKSRLKPVLRYCTNTPAIKRINMPLSAWNPFVYLPYLIFFSWQQLLLITRSVASLFAFVNAFLWAPVTTTNWFIRDLYELQKTGDVIKRKCALNFALNCQQNVPILINFRIKREILNEKLHSSGTRISFIIQICVSLSSELKYTFSV